MAVSEPGGHGVRSLVMTRIGGQDYPLRSEPRCNTCQSPHRMFIENRLIRGDSYASIAREVAALPHGEHKKPPNKQSISIHTRNGHMPLGQSTQRRIIERQALKAEKSIEDSEDPLVDYLTLNQLLVQQGFEKMATGELQFSASDVLRASQFLHDIEREAADDVDQEVWIEAMMEYMSIAKRFIPPQMWEQYGAALHGSSVLAALEKRMQKSEQTRPEQIEQATG